ncbi:MAG: response regulator [Fibrobacterales bacterium]
MKKIMIVDDDIDIMNHLCSIISTAGYEVCYAYDVEQALRVIEESKPDILIQDIVMSQPDDGIVFVQELRSKGYSLPIIMLSSINAITGHTYGIDNDLLPADAFLDKPIKSTVLLATIESLLSQEKD